MTTSALGTYLRSARSRVTPAQVGLPSVGQRRVSGLRREEISLLAGVSVDYYIRLEQGRERNPSPQVVNALATALQLDDDGRAHLFRLAGLSPQPRSGPVERVDPGLLQLMDMWPDNPALVLGRAYDVLTCNGLGEALFGGFPTSRNLAEVVFCDPDAPAFYADWPAAAANTVAGLRLAHGTWPNDPRLAQLCEDLQARSAHFRTLWRQNQARGKQLEVKTFHHPQVGPVTLRMQAFDVRAAPGQQLVVYHAEPGSTSAQALRLLGSLVATDRAGSSAADRDATRAGGGRASSGGDR